MAEFGGRSGRSAGSALATVLIGILLLWLLLKLLGVALKVIGLLVLGGIAVAAYLAITGRIGGPNRNA